MKKICLFILTIILGFAALSCETTNADGDVTISFSWWGTSDRNIATYQAIELFEAKYPQYHVEGEQAVWSGYQTTLYNQLERGREADVFQVNYNWLYSMDGEYYFTDLSDLGINLSAWPEGENAPLTLNDKLLGLSLSETGYVFYLNWKLYEDAGITTVPRTWDELIAAGQAIGAQSNGTKYALGRLDAQMTAIVMWTYLSQITGKNVINDENKLNFTRAELETGFAFINDLRANNVLIPSNANDTYNDGPTNPQWVTYQNYGGVLQWNTAISEYQNELPASANLICAGMFQQNAGEKLGMYKKVSMALAASKRLETDSAKAEAVRTFIEFMTTDPEAVAVLGVDRGVPSNTTAKAILEASTDPVFTDTLEWQGHLIVQEYYDHQITLSQNLYIHPYYEHDTFRRIYEMPIERFLFNYCNASDAIDDIISQFDSTLAQVMGD